MRARLRRGEEIWTTEDLDGDVRRGLLRADDEAWREGWTPIWALPELREAFDAPGARFAAWMRDPPRATLTAVIVIVIAVAGLVQRGAVAMASVFPALSTHVHEALLHGAVGYEPMLLDGAWWSPWTSQLLHADAVHLVTNLPVVAYCGYRVERAYGAGGLAVVGAAAVLGGTLAVSAMSALPVVGASILAFGFWGAQIAVGFRAGEAMPGTARGFYGWGNLVLFIPLFIASLSGEGISHAGHVGGLLGGVLAASLVGAESFAPKLQVAARRTRNVRLAAALAAAPMVLSPVANRLAPILALPSETVVVPNAGATLELPWRMVANPTTILGLPAWVVSPNHQEPLFCGLVRIETLDESGPDAMARAWSRVLGGPVSELPAPTPLGEGWNARAWRVGTSRVVQHQMIRGEWALLAGYVLSEDGVGRERLYASALATIVVSDPPALAEARRGWGLYPTDPARAWSLARELDRAGRYDEAEPVWLALASRTDGWRAEGARGRILGWTAAAQRGVERDEPVRAQWALAAVEADPQHAGLAEEAARWLVARGRCAEASQVAARSGIPVECRGSIGP